MLPVVMLHTYNPGFKLVLMYSSRTSLPFPVTAARGDLLNPALGSELLSCPWLLWSYSPLMMVWAVRVAVRCAMTMVVLQEYRFEYNVACESHRCDAETGKGTSEPLTSREWTTVSPRLTADCH